SRRSGSTQPWLLPLAGGEPTQLCELRGGVQAAEWSPDGRRVLLLADSGVDRFIVGDPERPVARRIDVLFWRLDGAGIRDQVTSAWVVGAGGGRARRVTPPESDVAGALWHPDGERIVFLADPVEGVYPQAWTIGLDGGRPRPLVRLAGEVENVAFAPDGTLALLGIDRPPPLGGQNLDLFVRDGRALQQLGAELDRPIGLRVVGDLIDVGALFPAPLHWLDGEQLVALVTDRGRAHPYRFGLDGTVERLVDGDVACAGLTVAAGRIVTVAIERGRPGELCA